jgi:hypothetical protein
MAFLVFSLTPSTALAQTTVGSPNAGDCFLGICDPGAWLQDTVGRIVSGLLGGLIDGITGAITVFPNDTDFIRRTPEALS